MGRTSIEWTAGDDGLEGRTWNPVRGCSVASPGCEHCYAAGIAARFSEHGAPFAGFARFSEKRRLPQWTGKVSLVREHLGDPLGWKKASRVFVNSMSDVFHEGLSFQEIAAIFGVMAAAPHHTFQLLTKRARRMREWFAWVQGESSDSRYSGACGDSPAEVVRGEAIPFWRAADGSMPAGPGRDLLGYDSRWPLPNVHLGVSVEDQHYADERIPELLRTPAALRFVSYEPALGPVDFDAIQIPDERAGLRFSALRRAHDDRFGSNDALLDWVIVGGESGPGARPFDVRWAERVVAQCREAGVAAFVKQLGAKPFQSPRQDGGTGFDMKLRAKKGNDMAEFPEALRVREMPRANAAEDPLR